MAIRPLPQFEADLAEDRKIYEKLKPPTTMVVRFGIMKLIGEFPYSGDAKPGCGSKVVVRTHRGIELAEMLTTTCPNSGCGKSVSRQDMLEYIENSGGRDYPFFNQGKVLRIATIDDLNQQAKLDAERPKMVMRVREIMGEMQGRAGASPREGPDLGTPSLREGSESSSSTPHENPDSNQGSDTDDVIPAESSDTARPSDHTPRPHTPPHSNSHAHFPQNMKVVDAEPILGNERLTFYFASEDRVDFRDLVARLASEYRVRIEMRQVGARDEARLVADYERCGQQCCCKQFLKVLKPVSMRSAKIQKATLDPLKISGRCGRLMCCLRYEDESYDDLRKRLPKKKVRLKTPEGWGIVMDTQILTQLVLIRLEDVDKEIALTVEELGLVDGIQVNPPADEIKPPPVVQAHDFPPTAAQPGGPPQQSQQPQRRPQQPPQRGNQTGSPQHESGAQQQQPRRPDQRDGSNPANRPPSPGGRRPDGPQQGSAQNRDQRQDRQRPPSDRGGRPPRPPHSPHPDHQAGPPIAPRDSAPGSTPPASLDQSGDIDSAGPDAGNGPQGRDDGKRRRRRRRRGPGPDSGNRGPTGNDNPGPPPGAPG